MSKKYILLSLAVHGVLILLVALIAKTPKPTAQSFVAINYTESVKKNLAVKPPKILVLEKRTDEGEEG